MRYCLFTALAAAASVAQAQPGYSTTVTGDVHDFDFFAGAWNTTHRVLKTRSVANDDWEVFPAVSCMSPYVDGLIQIAEMYMPTKSHAGLTVRTFNLETHQWALHSVSGLTGQMDPGVVGGFSDGKGLFYGTDVDNGRPIKVRDIWTEIDHDHARWEEAWSYDDRTWVTNWVAEFTRADPATACEQGRPKRQS